MELREQAENGPDPIRRAKTSAPIDEVKQEWREAEIDRVTEVSSVITQADS
jgi:hypothetical protein